MSTNSQLSTSNSIKRKILGMYDGVVRRSRCLAVAAVATAMAVLVAAALLRAESLGAPTDGTANSSVQAVAWLCRSALLVADVWAWAAVLAGVLEAWRTPRLRSDVRVSWIRRWVLAACGVALAGALSTPLGPAPALADPAPPTPTPVLTGLPMPDRALGPAHASPVVVVVVVVPGDSLWSIAAHHLGRGDRWPAIYRLNRAAIGADPDLIQPGTRLRLPTGPPTERTRR
jgi:nucleoid-associated protein YgaU